MHGSYADNRDRTGQQRAAQASRHRRDGHRAFASRRDRGRWAVLAAAVVVAVASGYVFVGAETARPGPPRVRPWPPVSLGRVSWPATGVSAAGISGLGVVAGPGARRPVPIASVAKVMTAYVILHDHPLNVGQSGPAFVVQPQEAAAYPAQVGNGDSLVPVAAGERISERQALVALLLPSADNMAWILARWDAGSQGAFVARMNATARRLGMTATRYTDPSGLAATTISTAADQVHLGIAAMGQPALAAIAAMRTAVIPVAGAVRNYNTLLDQNGIIGLKTGNTPAAGGCVLLAARQRAARRPILIIAASFGQPGTMQTMRPAALKAGDQLVLALDSALHVPTREKPGHPPDHRPHKRTGDFTG